MSKRFPPRYLPTLTEVVNPQVRAAPIAPSESVTPGSRATDASSDIETLARQVIELVTPQLEAELRTVAQELFEAQYSALLPSLHLQIDAAVREAINLALPDSANRND